MCEVVILKKNMIFDVNIDSINSSGFGVCRIDGLVVFVANAVAGDEVTIKIIKAKKNYAVARVEKFIKKSPIRIDSDCEVFKRCGGCAYRNISYEYECEIKKNMVKDAFERIGEINLELEEYIPAESRLRYRNKAQYPVAINDGKLNIGFYASRTHCVIDCRDCLLQPAVFSDIINSISYFIENEKIPIYDENTHTGVLRHIYLRSAQATGEIAVCLVINSKSLKNYKKLIRILTCKFPTIKNISLNFNTKRTNVILGKDTITIWGKNYITDILCSKKFNISPNSFYQVNHSQAQKLYNKAIQYASLTGKETVLDLFCGAGTIGLCMADKAKKIIGVEIIEDAIKNAHENAVLNGINNAEFICSDAEKFAEVLYLRNEMPDVIVVDPPRKGLTPKLIETIVKMSPQRIVYVSCDVATQARDCKILSSMGYSADKVCAVDMFPGTVHVETVVIITKKKINPNL